MISCTVVVENIVHYDHDRDYYHGAFSKCDYKLCQSLIMNSSLNVVGP